MEILLFNPYEVYGTAYSLYETLLLLFRLQQHLAHSVIFHALSSALSA